MKNEKQLLESIEVLTEILQRPFILVFPIDETGNLFDSVNAVCYTPDVKYSIDLLKIALRGIKDNEKQIPKFGTN